jgi:prevent-host-death family protein
MSSTNKSWPISEAKANLAKVVEEAREGPQLITHHGRDSAVVLSIAEYERLVDRASARLPAERWEEFLEASAAFRAAGGANLDVGSRGVRRSPFKR